MYCLHFQCSFLKIEIFFFLVMESSAIVWFCNKLCGAQGLLKGIYFKITLVLEKWRILRAFTISLSLLSMERKSKVFFCLTKNLMLQSDRTLFFHCHVFPPSPKPKIYVTSKCWFVVVFCLVFF